MLPTGKTSEVTFRWHPIALTFARHKTPTLNILEVSPGTSPERDTNCCFTITQFKNTLAL